MQPVSLIPFLDWSRLFFWDPESLIFQASSVRRFIHSRSKEQEHRISDRTPNQVRNDVVEVVVRQYELTYDLQPVQVSGVNRLSHVTLLYAKSNVTPAASTINDLLTRLDNLTRENLALKANQCTTGQSPSDARFRTIASAFLASSIFHFNGHTYFRSSRHLENITEAIAFCQGFEAYVTEIDSQQELDFLHSAFPWGGYSYVGERFSETTKWWQHIRPPHSAMPHITQYSGQDLLDGEGDAKCLLLTSGLLQDNRCTFPTHCICEFPFVL